MKDEEQEICQIKERISGLITETHASAIIKCVLHKITPNKYIMVRGSSSIITTLRLKMNDIGKAQRWAEDDILNVYLYCEVVELTTLHC